MYKYFVAFLGFVLVCAIVVLVFEKTQNSSRKNNTQYQTQNQRKYIVGVISNSPILNSVFDVFKQKFNELQANKEYGVTYVSVTTAYTDNDIANTLNFFTQEKVNLIITGQSQAVTLKKLNVQIPVIVAIASNPVESGLAKSDDGSGNILTFVDTGNFVIAGERLRFFHELNPKARKVLILRGDSSTPGESDMPMSVLQSVAKTEGMVLVDKKFANREDLNAFILKTDFSDVDAVFRYPGPFMAANMDVVFNLQNKIAKPIITLTRQELERGGILSYSSSVEEQGELTASLADHILNKHADPSMLPISHNYKFELGVNEKQLAKYNLVLSKDFKNKVDYTVGK